MSAHNREEAIRAAHVGKTALERGDASKAIRFLEKSINMYPTTEAQTLLRKAQSGEGIRQRPKTSPKQTARKSPTVPQQQDTRPYTPQQLAEVKKVIACKDLYEMLGVSKDADPSAIKKAYRKKAIKLHPDKNSAPKADEAFKEINRAYSVLSDADKKANYDQFGETSDNPAAQYRRQYQGQEFDAADIFREVFGAGFAPGGGVRMNFGQGGGMFRQQRGRQAENNQAPTNLMSLLPLLLLLMMSLGNFFSDLGTSPDFSLSRDSTYNTERFTSSSYSIPDIPYYVPRQFNTKLGLNPRLIGEIEKLVSHQHFKSMESKCLHYSRGRRSADSFQAFPRKTCAGSTPRTVPHTNTKIAATRNFCATECLRNFHSCQAFVVSLGAQNKMLCQIYSSCSQIDDGGAKTELWINACEEVKRLRAYSRY